MIRITDVNKQGCFEAVVLGTCPKCDKRTLMTYGVFSTGVLELSSGYLPTENELIKNHSSACQSCDWDQYS